jgi:arsenate reductase
MNGHYNILFVCTGNSARSLMAESVMRQFGRDRFTAFSAGSHPTGRAEPAALAVLEAAGLPTQGLRSKSWDEFTAPGMPPMDFIITVCDRAAGEPCPEWPGHPITAHWTVPDPTLAAGDSERMHYAFRDVLSLLQKRITLLLALPAAALDRQAIDTHLQQSATAPASQCA